jgi:murein L,D-transpeptidase YcbB/YkuD
VIFEGYLPSMSPRAVFLHTNGGGTGGPGVGLRNWWNTLWLNPSYGCAGQGIGSTFQVFTNGQFDQYVDSSRVIFAQFQASRWSGVIETEDDGNPGTPWTDAQMHAIADILSWYGATHGVPMRLMQSPTDSGIGYHEQFREWNGDGHACPGTVRERQLLTEIIPSLSRHPAQGDDVMTALPTIGGRSKKSAEYQAALQHPQAVQNVRGLLKAHGMWADVRYAVWDEKDCGAVEGFQKTRGLTADAVVGPMTWAALLDVKV